MVCPPLRWCHMKGACPAFAPNILFCLLALQKQNLGFYFGVGGFFHLVHNLSQLCTCAVVFSLAWKTPWTEEPSRLQSMGSGRVGHD